MIIEHPPLGERYAAILEGPTPAEKIEFDRIMERIFRERGIGQTQPNPLRVLPSGECPYCHQALDISPRQVGGLRSLAMRFRSFLAGR